MAGCGWYRATVRDPEDGEALESHSQQGKMYFKGHNVRLNSALLLDTVLTL